MEEIKRQLLSHDVATQNVAVNWIFKELKAKPYTVEMLIRFDVITILCEALVTSSGALLKSMLECLEILTKSRHFYTQNHIFYAVESILRVAYFMAKIPNEQSKYLGSAIYTLFVMLNGAVQFHVTLSRICSMEQILEFLKNLKPRHSSDYILRFSAAKLLCVVLKYIPKVDDDFLTFILPVYQESLESMKMIIKEKDEDHVHKVLIVICDTCALGTRLCLDNSNIDNNLKACAENCKMKNIELWTILAKCIYATMIEVVIPCVNHGKLNRYNSTMYINFMQCLNNLYQLNDCDPIDLSNHLAAKGFLKCLSKLMTLSKKNLRRATCLLISQILTTLASSCPSINKWLLRPTEFQRFLFKGLILLPLTSKKWIPLLETSTNETDVLLILLYYHFLNTDEDCTPYLPSLIVKVLSLPKCQQVASPILRALWFLFAISSLSHSSAHTLVGYERAVKRLNDALLIIDPKECYTHHLGILYHSLLNTEMSSDLQTKVIHLWLESGGDIEALFKVDHVEASSHCLLNIIQTGSEKMVDLTVNGICIHMQNKTIAKGIASIVWETLPQVLASHTKDNSKNIRGLLQVANLLVPQQISIATIRRCSILLVKIVVRDTDFRIKTLAVKQAYILMTLSIVRKDAKVIVIYLNEPEMLRELLKHGFSNNNLELSAACLKCLSFMIHCQSEFSVQCVNGLTIEMAKLIPQLWNVSKSLCSMQLIHVLFSYNIERPVIALQEFQSNFKSTYTIKALYMLLHRIHIRSGLEGRDLVCRCLSAMLKYCYNSKNRLILKNLVEQPWTHILIMSTLDSCHVSPLFTDFVCNWLYYQRYCSSLDFVSSTRNRKENKTLYRNCFEETLNYLIYYLNATKADVKDKDLLLKLTKTIIMFESHIPKESAALLREKYDIANTDLG